MARKHHPAAHAEGDDSDPTLDDISVELLQSQVDNAFPEIALEEIAEREAAKEAEAAEEEAARAERIKSCAQVLILCDHVYLPEDPTADDWASARVTVRYDGVVNERRARVTVHPSLAAFLQKRGQAEILD
jgi:hypothetical protein